MLQAVRRFFSGSTPEPQAQDPPDWAWTPDQWVLEQYIQQLLFIPNGMQYIMDIPDEDELFIKEVSPSVYTDAHFLAYKRDRGKDLSSALVMPGDYKPSGHLTNGTPPGPAKVRGTLHLVWSHKLYLLDKEMQNGVQFSRQRVRIIYPWRYVSYGKKNPIPNISHHGFKVITGWMYVGVPSYWDDRIGGLFAQPLNTYEHEGRPRPWIGEFYDYK